MRSCSIQLRMLSVSVLIPGFVRLINGDPTRGFVLIFVKKKVSAAEVKWLVWSTKLYVLSSNILSDESSTRVFRTTYDTSALKYDYFFVASTLEDAPLG